MTDFRGFLDRCAGGIAVVSILAQLPFGTPAKASDAPAQSATGRRAEPYRLRQPNPPLVGINFKLDAPSVAGDGPGEAGQRGGVVGDLNSDGTLDIVTANLGEGNNRVFWTDQNGNLTESEYPAAQPNAAVAVADFDGDLNQDLVSARTMIGGRVAISQGTGGGFGAPQELIIGTGVTDGVATGDLNGDLKSDFVAVLNNGGAWGTVQVMLGNGDMTFTAGDSELIHPSPRRVLVERVNDDSIPDVVIPSLGQDPSGGLPGAVSVLMTNPDGSLQSPIVLSPGNGTFAVAARDIDLDGKTEIAAVNFGSQTLVIYRNTGNPGALMFEEVASFPLPARPTGVAIGDFTASGKMSVAVSMQNGGPDQAVYLFEGTSTPGNITLSAPVSIPTTDSVIRSLAVYPCPGHDKLVVVEDDRTSVVDITKRDRVYDMSGNVVGAESVWGTRADINNDGIDDQLVLSGNDIANQGEVVFRLGQADGSLGPKQTFSVGEYHYLGQVGNFDGDNFKDLLVGNGDGSRIYHGTGSGFSSSNPTQLPEFGGTTATVADLNGDGRMDLASTVGPGAGIGYVGVAIQQTDGSFVVQWYPTAGSGTSAVAAGELTGDSIPDLVASDHESGSVSILPGLGGGAFGSPVEKIVGSLGSQPSDVAVGRLNPDNIDDIVVSNRVGEIVTLIGTGSGQFDPPRVSSSGNTPGKLSLEDFNGDGTSDVVTIDQVKSTVAFHSGNGDGFFAGKLEFGTGGLNPIAVSPGTEPMPDLYVVCRDTRTATWINNSTPGGTTDVPPLPTPDRPGRLEMSPPFPNPVNGVSVITFALAEPAAVEINVYNVSGGLVRALLPRQAFPAGPHTLRWDHRDALGSDVAAGIYFIRAETDGDGVTRRVIVIK